MINTRLIKSNKVKLGLLISAMAIVTGCGGGSSTQEFPALQPVQEGQYPVSGAIVKGPLINANVAVYRLDFTKPDLIGIQVGEGFTDQTATINGLIIEENEENNDFYMLIATNGSELDGSEPVINPLKTLVSSKDIISGQPVFATPLTTLALEMLAIKKTNSAQFSSALREVLVDVEKKFGFGVLGKVPIFTSSPIISHDTEQSSSLAYRLASESFAAVLNELHQQVISSGITQDSNTTLQQLVSDIGDGELDGMTGSQEIAAFRRVNNLHEILNQSVDQLLIPGTDSVLAELTQVLISEAALLNPTVSVEDLPVLNPKRILLSDDSDGDFVIDALDVFPNNPREWADSDNDWSSTGRSNTDHDAGDYYGDNSDALPNDGSEWFDHDGDGVGNNADVCPFDNNRQTGSPDNCLSINCDDRSIPLFIRTQESCNFVDADGDGIEDQDDYFPNNSLRYQAQSCYQLAMHYTVDSEFSSSRFENGVYADGLAEIPSTAKLVVNWLDWVDSQSSPMLSYQQGFSLSINPFSFNTTNSGDLVTVKYRPFGLVFTGTNTDSAISAINTVEATGFSQCEALAGAEFICSLLGGSDLVPHVNWAVNNGAGLAGPVLPSLEVLPPAVLPSGKNSIIAFNLTIDPTIHPMVDPVNGHQQAASTSYLKELKDTQGGLITNRFMVDTVTEVDCATTP